MESGPSDVTDPLARTGVACGRALVIAALQGAVAHLVTGGAVPRAAAPLAGMPLAGPHVGTPALTPAQQPRHDVRHPTPHAHVPKWHMLHMPSGTGVGA